MAKKEMYCQNPNAPVVRECPDCVDAVIQLNRRLYEVASGLEAQVTSLQQVVKAAEPIVRFQDAYGVPAEALAKLSLIVNAYKARWEP